MRCLSPEDLSILSLENDVVVGHTCKVILLADQVDLELLRASIASRLPRVPELCMRLAQADGRPCWIFDPALDVNFHVVAREDSQPPHEAGLRTVVADLFAQRLDRSRPLWRIDLIPELRAGGSALIWRIHHALADGSTAMRMATAALWDAQLGTDVSSGGTTARSSAQRHHQAARDRRLAGLRALTREVPQPWRRSPFNGQIGARRAVAFATAPLEGLRRVAAHTDGATVNDAVLTVVAGGLRRWLEATHGSLGAVRVKVPVSLHGAEVSPDHHGGDPGNRDSFFCLDLPLESSDPFARLAAVHRATKIRKDGHDAQHLDALMRQLGHVPQLRHFAERVLAHPRSFALNVSNVPGPRQPVRVLGVPVRALYSLAEIRAHHALRVAVVSLGDTLNFGLASDPTLVPHVDQLASYMRAEAVAMTAPDQL